MKQDRRRVVVTGLGVIAPNATGLPAFEDALRTSRSGLRHIPALADYKFACQVGGIPQDWEERLSDYFAEDEQLALSESMKYTGMAAVDAWKDAGLEVPDRDGDTVHETTGAIVGTGIGGLDIFAGKVYPAVTEQKIRRLGSTMVEQIMMSSVSALVGGKLALGSQITTNSSACSTGTEALIMGADRIRAGLADRMVVGGAEGSSPFIWAGFDSMRVLSRNFNDRPEQASRPMSASAGGFVPGSGAGILILEELETARARGARIYAEVAGTALTSGGMRRGGSMTAPSPDGVRRAIRTAILDAEVTAADVDYINGHLTATFADPGEVTNWSEALERKGDQLPLINSTKSLIGHALGAAGAIECVGTVLQLSKGFVHGSINCEDLHPELESYSASIVRETREAPLNCAAKASFGFGDVNSCIIFKKL